MQYNPYGLIAKLLTPVLMATMLFSANAQATKVKLLFAPGATDPGFGFVAADYQTIGKIEGTVGYGITLDLGDGPVTFALDVYHQPDTSNKYSLTTRRVYDANLPSITVNSRVTEATTATSMMIGARWNHRGGFYVGGGMMIIENKPEVTSDNTLTVPSAIIAVINQRPDVAERQQATALLQNGRVNTKFTGGNRYAYTPAFTIGYDYSFNSGLNLGVHLMRSFAVNANSGSLAIVPNPTLEDPTATLATDATATNFYMQSLSLSLGYEW